MEFPSKKVHVGLTFSWYSPWYPFTGAAFLPGGRPRNELLLRLRQLPLQFIHLFNIINDDTVPDFNLVWNCVKM